MAKAYLLYSQAAALEPGNQLYWLRSQAVRSRAALEAKPLPKQILSTGSGANPEDAELEITPASSEDLAEARKPLPPRELKAAPVRKTFRRVADAKALFETVAHAYGLDVVFDGDYEAGKPIRFQMDDVDYRDALHGLEAATASFIVPLSERLFLVAKDTPQKRNDVEPMVAVSIPLPEVTNPQELAGIVTAVQQTMAIKKIGWDTQQNVVVLRDTLSRVLPAQRLFQDLLYPRAQVNIELEFLEVAKSDLNKYGLTIPNAFPLYALTTAWNNKPDIADGLAGLLGFGGGKTLIGIGISNAAAIAQLTQSTGRVLLKGDLRSLDGQAASFHVGERFPIMTSGYFGPSNFTQGGTVYTPPPSFNFEDLGLSIKATPKVHGLDEVTLELDASYKVLTGALVDGIPVVSNRELKSTVSLKTGQWAVVAGLVQAQEVRALSGIAGLSRVPFLGPLTRTTTKQRDSSAVLMLLRPKLVTLPPDQVVTHTYYLGSENRPVTPL